MLDRQSAFEPIILSSEGIHISAYVPMEGPKNQRERTLTESLKKVCLEARICIEKNSRSRNIDALLTPIERLTLNPGQLLDVEGTIGIFRNHRQFRIVSVPLPTPFACMVASSFHVKPLLQWFQQDQGFAFLGLEEGCVHLYVGTQRSVRRIESLYFAPHTRIAPSDQNSQRPHPNLSQVNQILSWAQDLLEEFPPLRQNKLFLTDPLSRSSTLQDGLWALDWAPTLLPSPFATDRVGESLIEIREAMSRRFKAEISIALDDFDLAKRIGLARDNIFEIARFAANGNVRTLFIAADVNLYGTLDRKTGELSLHSIDRDHEDDDLLDDIAQLVWSHGGRVVVVPHSKMPKLKPIGAILNEDSSLMVSARHHSQRETLEERFG